MGVKRVKYCVAADSKQLSYIHLAAQCHSYRHAGPPEMFQSNIVTTVVVVTSEGSESPTYVNWNKWQHPTKAFIPESSAMLQVSEVLAH